MKRLNYILIVLIITLICCNKKKISKKESTNNLVNIKWENSDLDCISFSNSIFYFPVKERYSTHTCNLKYSVFSDTIRVINKSTNDYPLFYIKDSVSILKIKQLSKDSLSIELVNDAAKTLFKGFENLKFYNSKTVDRFSFYKEKDSICLKKVNLAVEQAKQNKLVLLMYRPWNFRQIKEFASVLKEYNIEFVDLGPYPDLPVFRDCYQETMNYLIEKKYGTKFIENLIVKADSLMLKRSNERYFYDYECDKEAHPLGVDPSRIRDLTAKVDLMVKDSVTTSNFYRPFMDIEFNIDTTGIISKFHLNYFNPELEWNKPYEEKLFQEGILRIKKYPIWVPGKINGIKVPTRHNVRVFFEGVDYIHRKE